MRLFVAIVSIWTLCLLQTQAQAVLAPPFGLKWGEPPKQILDWAKRHALDVSIQLIGKAPHEKRLVIRNADETLPEHAAYALEARFYKEKLYEVVLDYTNSTSGLAQKKARFFEMKRVLSQQYGAFKLSSKNRSIEEDKYVTETTSYHVEPVSGIFLMLSYTEVRDILRDKAVAQFSIMYHNDNVVPERRR